MAGQITAVIGGQYGSEGKGVIVNHIADLYEFHVRVGGPNAGHSFYRMEPDSIGGVDMAFLEVMQQLPCGWTNKDAMLVIGPGAVVDMEQLVLELDHVEKTYDPDVRRRVIVSSQAFPLTQAHHISEGGVEGSLHKQIGSTGHGVGAARHDRMSRGQSGTGNLRMEDASDGELVRWNLKRDQIRSDVPELLLSYYRRGRRILLEGTQGSGLSLIHGPWPYVTSADTNAAQLMADVGLAPQLLDQTIMVCRTYPIRVAGNSGPMNSEITWDELNRRLGKEGITERTTVTKKTRRISEWDERLVQRACTLNQPTDIALTFLDYLTMEDEGKTDWADLSPKSKGFIEYVETLTGVPCTLLGTGGQRWNVIERNFRVR